MASFVINQSGGVYQNHLLIKNILIIDMQMKGLEHVG